MTLHAPSHDRFADVQFLCFDQALFTHFKARRRSKTSAEGAFYLDGGAHLKGAHHRATLTNDGRLSGVHAHSHNSPTSGRRTRPSSISVKRTPSQGWLNPRG